MAVLAVLSGLLYCTVMVVCALRGPLYGNRAETVGTHLHVCCVVALSCASSKVLFADK